ncbi:MAG TPA: protein kinase [Gemmatimonadales bacterium]|nr:protein kinase [Gemmatimonadales bacterium]
MQDLLPRLQAALADRYRIERPLGRGGMATVYLAHDLRHDRPVALKVFHPELTPALGERFVQEVRVAAKLSHPHILTIHDSGEAGGLLWYTMPVVDGESLRQRLDREGQLPVGDAVRIACTVAEALAHAHAHGIVHRDIKPENILLFAGEPMVADFGIALALDRVGQERLTQTGFSLGTPAYMSPEQACAEPHLDGRTDIYSLGCVLYEMLAGEPPYTGPTAQAIMAKRLSQAPLSLRTVREVPEALDQAIQTALARNPADRFMTAHDFARAITEGAAAWPGATVPARRPRRTLSRTTRTLGGLLLLAMAATVSWIAFGRRPPPAAPARLAVLPFAVPAGGSFAYLAQGMVDLLSRNLNGAEALVTVDPGRVMSAAGRGETGGPDAEKGGDIARRLGAGQYIIGSVVPAGGQLRIQAQLYAQDSTASPAIIEAAVEGDSAKLFELVDQLTAQLLVRRGQGQGARLAQTAAVTTRSLPALKLYLDAERNLRAAQYDSAIAGFQRAIEVDSSFALAHYRLAVAGLFVGRMGLIGPAMERGLALDQRLIERDRRLLAAFADLVRGKPDRAEQQYREFLEAYPDDVEAQFELANLLYTYNASRGRSPAEAREQYVRVLQVDPKFLCPI